MPNGPMKFAPQLEGSKPRVNMNCIDREGLGPEVLRLGRQGLSCRKISDEIQAKYNIFIAYRNISFYLETFRDPITGTIVPEDKLPAIPDRQARQIARTIHEMLEEEQVNDVTILETLAHTEMNWFKDPDNPVPLKLKVAKELRETIKLKLELGGIVKPAPTVQNNNLYINQVDLEKFMMEKPETVAMLRELLYLASGQGDVLDKGELIESEGVVIPDE